MGEGDQGQEVNFAFVSPWSLVKGSAYAVTKPQQEARRVRRARSSRRACRAWIDREDRSAFIRRLGDALLPV
jgi:hypothetical protein